MRAKIKYLFLLFSLALCRAETLFAQLKFLENKGQWPAEVRFKAELNSADFWITTNGLIWNLWDPGATEYMHDRNREKFSMKGHSLFIRFSNARWDNVSGQGEVFKEEYNFFRGQDQSGWASGVHAWPALLVRDIYPGVDLELFESNGQIKYNIICRQNGGAKWPEMLEMEYLGADSLYVKEKQLVISTSVSEIKEQMPAVWSESDQTGRSDIPATYHVSGNKVRFIPQDRFGLTGIKSRIVIDPVLVFSTFSGSRADNFGCTGTYDDNGNAYAGGTVFDVGLPVTPGAWQRNFGGGRDENLGYGGERDAAILKFSPDGRTLLYCTYLGGDDNEQPHSMVADNAGNLFIMGSTRSCNFPVTSGAYRQLCYGDYDFFVAKLSPDGRTLMGSIYFGSNGFDAVGANREVNPIDDYPLLYSYADEFRGEIVTDNNNVYIAGTTFGINFPRSNNSGWFGGKQDAVIFSFNSDLSSLNWSQILGSSGYDCFYGLTIGKNGDLYASGGTSSSDLQSRFPLFKNGYQGGLADGMVARFRKSDGKLLSATHLGTASYDQAYFAQTDNQGNPYFFGHTEGVMPIQNANYGQSARGQFIQRLDTQLQNITLSTTFGANGNLPNISPSAFLVDRCERIFISGWGGETNDALTDGTTGLLKTHRNRGNTRNLQVTSDAAQRLTDGSDFYVAVFSKNMQGLAYATFFGGISTPGLEAHEHVDGGTSRFDKKGIIYQSLCGGCRRNGLFPTTPGAYSRTMNSSNCNNAMFKIDFENLNLKPRMRDTFIEITATDNIDLLMKAIDPDPFDTVRLSWQVVKSKSGSSLPLITDKPGLGSAELRFQWNTLCNDFWNDTFEIRVMIYDRGCPSADTTYATIKVKINEPPVIEPPETLCINSDRSTGNVRILWESSTQPARFFKYYLLFRRNPDNSVVCLDTIRNTNAGDFQDVGLTNPKTNNYCYYFVGVSTCNIVIKARNEYCTVNELNTPITSVPVKFATVELDRRVRIEWGKSNEQDFKEYEVYRYLRGGQPGTTPVFYTTDTFYTDSSLNVDAESFCYTVLVVDQCSHVSKPGGEACNVVLTGTQTGRPQYHFDLTWMDYQQWAGGVLNWNVERQYSINPWTSIGNTTALREFRDDKPDYDWGGYWFRVTAVENVQSVGRLPYTSQSNWIYLYHPPELWVPNAFTRNNDNLNDSWGTVPLFVRNYHMRVYDRWGQKVWESTDKKRQWNGEINGRQAQDGVYAWYVIFDGWDNKTYRMKGTVTILH